LYDNRHSVLCIERRVLAGGWWLVDDDPDSFIATPENNPWSGIVFSRLFVIPALSWRNRATKKERETCSCSMILDCGNGSLNRQLQHPYGIFFYIVLSQNSQWFLISLGDDGRSKWIYFVVLMCKKFHFRPSTTNMYSWKG